MKKWKIYLPLLSLCSALVVTGGIWGILRSNVWNGQMELRHLEGDESALADFTMEGKITDYKDTWNFSIQDGKLEKTSFCMGTGTEFAYPVEQAGGIWKEGELEIWHCVGSLVPTEDSQIEIKDMVDLTVLDENTYFAGEAYQEDGTLQGTTTTFDKGQVVFQLEMQARAEGGAKFRDWNYEIPTQLIYTPEKPISEVYVENGENFSETNISDKWGGNAPLLVWSKDRQMLYGTMATNSYCSGSIGLYCFGPDPAEDYTPASDEDERIITEPFATLAEIPVSENRWVLGLEDVGEGLLLFIGEADSVTAELYSYEGELLDSKNIQTGEPVHEIEVQQTDWESGRGIYVKGSQNIEENAYFVHCFAGYWVEDGILSLVYLPEDGQGDVTRTAVGKDRVLTIRYKEGEWGGKAEAVHGNIWNGLELCVYDMAEDLAGRWIYRGELETDIDEDMLEFLATSKTEESNQSIQRQNLRRLGGWNRYLKVMDISGKGGERVWEEGSWYHY